MPLTGTGKAKGKLTGKEGCNSFSLGRADF